MIKPHTIVTRIDVIQDRLNQLIKDFADENWEVIEDGRQSESTWSGDANHQILKANYDEAEVEAKSANIKRKIKLNELRDYERQFKQNKDGKNK